MSTRLSSRLSRCLVVVCLLAGTTAFTALWPATPVGAADEGTITGKVTFGATALPYNRPWVQATTLDGSFEFQVQGNVDGTYSMILRPSSYCVSFSATRTQAPSETYLGKRSCLDNISPVTVITGTTTPNINGAVWNGFISGKVLDGGGHPVQGVTVQAQHIGGNTVASTAPSAADGSYTIDHIEDGTFCLRSSDPRRPFVDAAANGCPTHTHRVFSTGNDSHPFINLTIGTASFVPSGSISGRVTRATGGAALANITVDAFTRDGVAIGSGQSAADGSYTISNVPPGKFCVTTEINGATEAAEAYHDRPTCDANPTLVTVANGNVPNIDFALDAGGSISGRITDSGGNGVQTTVSVRGVPFFSGTSVTSDASGNYTMHGLPAGTYCVSAVATATLATRSYPTGVSCARGFASVMVAPGAATTGINITMVPGGTITGHVTIPFGQSYGDLLVLPTNRDNAGLTNVTVSPAGDYTIPNLTPDDYCIHVRPVVSSLILESWFGYDRSSADGVCTSPPVSVTSGAATDFGISMALGGSISGFQVNPDQSPVDHGQPQSTPSGGRNYGLRPDGSYQLTGLAPGNWCVSTSPDGLFVRPGAWNNVTQCGLAATPVTVSAGMNTPNINFRLGAAGTITGNVLLPPGSPGNDQTMQVVLRRIDGTTADVSTTVGTGFYGYRRPYSINASAGTFCVFVTTTDASAAASRAYGGTRDCNGATPVTVGNDQQVDGIDIALPSQIFIPLAVPERFADTRVPSFTGDGLENGGGALAGGVERQIAIGGRLGVPVGAASVSINVTVTNTTAAGFLTVFPCGSARPLASNVNFGPGQTVANSVIAALGTAGKICLFSNVSTDVVIDGAGYFPLRNGYTPLATPLRLVDTRAGAATVDGVEAGAGPVVGGVVRTVTVAGRAGVPSDAATAALTVTVTDPLTAGFLSVYPCGTTPPLASSLNFEAGQTVANLTIAALGSGAGSGAVCVKTNATTDVVVDVAGYFADTAGYTPLAAPARLTDTRPDGNTTDGAEQRGGALAGLTERQVTVAGRAGIPADAAEVALNLTAVNPTAPGFILVFPCGNPHPLASTLNFGPGQTAANSAIVKLGTVDATSRGKVCLLSNVATDVVLDVGGYFVG